MKLISRPKDLGLNSSMPLGVLQIKSDLNPKTHTSSPALQSGFEIAMPWVGSITVNKSGQVINGFSLFIIKIILLING